MRSWEGPLVDQWLARYKGPRYANPASLSTSLFLPLQPYSVTISVLLKQTASSCIKTPGLYLYKPLCTSSPAPRRSIHPITNPGGFVRTKLATHNHDASPDLSPWHIRTFDGRLRRFAGSKGHDREHERPVRLTDSSSGTLFIAIPPILRSAGAPTTSSPARAKILLCGPFRVVAAFSVPTRLAVEPLEFKCRRGILIGRGGIRYRHFMQPRSSRKTVTRVYESAKIIGKQIIIFGGVNGDSTHSA